MSEPEKPAESELALVLELRRAPGRFTRERLPGRVKALNRLLARYRWLEDREPGGTPEDVTEAAELAMEGIRSSPYLTDEVTRSESLRFLELLQGRIGDLHEELSHETLKHGD